MDENTAGRGVGLPENVAPLCLVASDGTDWDDMQSETWFVEDGQGGVFSLSASCFLEAVEGFGVLFLSPAYSRISARVTRQSPSSQRRDSSR